VTKFFKAHLSHFCGKCLKQTSAVKKRKTLQFCEEEASPSTGFNFDLQEVIREVPKGTRMASMGLRPTIVSSGC